MKLRHAISALAMPLLSLTIAISASGIAAAQETGATTQGQRDRNTTTLPDDSSTTQRSQGQGRDNTEAQGRANSQAAQQGGAHTPGEHDCKENAPALPDNQNQNAQGANPQANANAQGARADENQSEQGAANSRADIAHGGDDCLPGNTNRSTNEDARGQGTGNIPGNNSSTNSPGANSDQTRGNDD